MQKTDECLVTCERICADITTGNHVVVWSLIESRPRKICDGHSDKDHFYFHSDVEKWVTDWKR